MIIYKGIKKKDKVSYIIFSNERNDEIEIPLEDNVAKRFSLYFNKIAISESKHVECQNDEPSD
ncbi:MAG: hypothetical protein Q8P20_09485 [bacterium]|nr:hypothetical protein [bacterium]